MKSGAETYRLRHKEQDTLSAILNLLIVYENSGRIAHCDRLNSGRVFIPYTTKAGQRRGRMIRLCREGTPDAFFITNKGRIVWIEVKSKKGRQRFEQERFEKKVKKLPSHEYWVVRGIEEFERRLKEVMLNVPSE